MGRDGLLRLMDRARDRSFEVLSKGVRAGDSEAAEAIRELIETVTVFRDHSRPSGVTVEITGRLNALLGERAYPNGVRGVWGKMVAEERYQQYHHGGFRRKWPTCSMWPEFWPDTQIAGPTRSVENHVPQVGMKSSVAKSETLMKSDLETIAQGRPPVNLDNAQLS